MTLIDLSSVLQLTYRFPGHNDPNSSSLGTKTETKVPRAF